MYRNNLISFLIICFLLCGFESRAQTDSILNIVDFSLDGFGNLYVAKKNSELLKINSEGKMLRVNSRKDLGIPTSINAENQLRILIFYREQGWLIVADNQLAFQLEIDLKQIGFTDPTLTACSFDGGIWIFDHGDGTLNKIMLSATGVQVVGAIDLRQILYTELNPQRLITDGNYLVLSNNNILYVLDRYGTYIRKIELDSEPSSINIEGTQVIATTPMNTYYCDIRYLSKPTKYEMNSVSNTRKWVITMSKQYELLLNDVLRISPSKK